MAEINYLTQIAIQASIEAGKEILKVYHSDDFGVSEKEDSSPLTQADLNANLAIKNRLAETGIPVLSEEGREIPYESRKDWSCFWLVDPLDGTKEFIKRNGEFTVNIAYMENNQPVAGVVYVPVTGTLYFANYKIGSYTIPCDENTNLELSQLISAGNKLPYLKPEKYTVVGSRSHMSEETTAFVEELKSKHGEVNIVSKGSALKLCLVAEGSADIYPRFGPTMEWDTAAGHAVAKYSGAMVYRSYNNKDLEYNKKNLLNPFFIVERSKESTRPVG